MQALGLNALTGGGTLVVAGQPFLVTPECVVTPLMPVYLAWALTWPTRLRARIAAVLLFVPLFVGLGFVRLLTVALPSIIGPPLFLTHGFYQFLTALLIVAAAARVGARNRRIAFPSAFGMALLAAVVATLLLAPPFRLLVDGVADLARLIATHTLTTRASVVEVQGAFSIMPGFELSLLCALAVAVFGRDAVRPLVALIPVMLVAQVLTLVIAGEASARLAAIVPVTVIRVVSILTPLLLVLAVIPSERRWRFGTPELQATGA